MFTVRSNGPVRVDIVCEPPTDAPTPIDISVPAGSKVRIRITRHEVARRGKRRASLRQEPSQPREKSSQPRAKSGQPRAESSQSRAGELSVSERIDMPLRAARRERKDTQQGAFAQLDTDLEDYFSQRNRPEEMKYSNEITGRTVNDGQPAAKASPWQKLALSKSQPLAKASP